MENIEQPEDNGKSIGERIQTIREYLRLTQTELAEKIELTQPALNVIESGKRAKVDVILLQRIAYLYPQISTNYIFMGKGEMLNDNEKQSEIIELPFFSMMPSATFGNAFTDNFNHIVEKIMIYKSEHEDYRDTFVIEVDGESMEPTIPNRSKILAKKIDPNQWGYLNGGVYIFDFAEQLVIKRIKSNTLMVSKRIELFSDNEQYGSMVVKLQDIRHIAKVIRIVDAKVY